MPTSEIFRREQERALRRKVREQHGRILAGRYQTLQDSWWVQCQRGHRFKITAKNILRGLWCADCRPLARQAEFLAYAQSIARQRGGKCLAHSYENARTKLPWQCRKKHRWRASLDNVANKHSWCPMCAAVVISDTKKRWWRQARKKRARNRRA